MGSIVNEFDFAYCGNMSGVDMVQVCDKFNWFLNYYPWYSSREGKREVASQIAIEEMQKNPNLMYVRHKYEKFGEECLESFGDWCYDQYLFDAVAYILKHKKGATVIGANGMSLGMKCASRGVGWLAMNCADNETAMTQLSEEQKDIGMYAAERFLLDLVAESIKYDGVATRQRVKDGKNIGMICGSRLPFEVEEAKKHIEIMRQLFENEVARGQKDNMGKTMFDILADTHFTYNIVHGPKHPFQAGYHEGMEIKRMYTDFVYEMENKYVIPNMEMND